MEHTDNNYHSLDRGTCMNILPYRFKLSSFYAEQEKVINSNSN